MNTKFLVLDIPATFKAILGRPWLKQVYGVSSTVHQCIKFPFQGNILKVQSIPILETMDSVPPAYLPTMQDGPVAPLLSILDISPILKATPSLMSPLVSDDQEEFDPSNVGWGLMSRMGHRPGHGLGKEEQGRRRAIEDDGNIGKMGLGYQFTNANKPSRNWKLSNHFVQGPTEGATLGESLTHSSHSSQSSVPLPIGNFEEEEIDYGLTLMLHTPDEGSSHSISPISIDPPALEASQNSHFIPVDDPQDAQCLMLSVIDRQKKTPKLQHGIALCPWKSPELPKKPPLLMGSSSHL